MNTKQLIYGFSFALAAIAFAGDPELPIPQGSAFTYQGKLGVSGNPLNDSADFQFTLWEESVDGMQIGETIMVSDVAVVNGLFSVELDFGDNAFTGYERWLEIDVRSPHAPSDTVPYTTLIPRQPITVAPVAMALRGFRTIPSGNESIDSIDSWNVVGGHPVNNIAEGIGSATVAGGGRLLSPNSVTASHGTVSGGLGNVASGDHGTVSGGAGNTASGVSAFVGGGNHNIASGRASTVAGGGKTAPFLSGNTASGELSTIPGGGNNIAAGRLSFAAGQHAHAYHDGAFVWSDSSGSYFDSTGNNQFLIRATGGVGINKNDPATALDVSGTVTADAFVGDGSALTGISGGDASFGSSGGSPDDAVFVDDEGRVGIGTTPMYPLHLNLPGTPVPSYPESQPGQDAHIQFMVNGAGVTGGGLAISDSGGFFDLNDGYVTYLPLSNGQGMRVQGSLRVVQNAWPDYVFEDGYDLKSLKEVKAFIDAHGHLPDIPSAREVQADGVDVGEINAALLRKIEELTLHVIELRDEVDRMKGTAATTAEIHAADAPAVELPAAAPAFVPVPADGDELAELMQRNAADIEDEFDLVTDSEFSPADLEGGPLDADGNTVLGDSAGVSMITGDALDNTLIGVNAGKSITDGDSNTFLGKDAGLINTATGNTFLGAYAGVSNTTGSANVLIGKDAGRLNTATDNTFIGSEAGENNTTGFDNTFIGEEAGTSNTEGIKNTFIGEDSGTSNTTGQGNTAVGERSLASNNTGYNNTVLGVEAGYDLRSHDNTCVGHQAGTDIGDGVYNTMIGADAGSHTEHADYNTFVGVYAGADNNRTNSTTNANRNTYMGVVAGASCREGQDNVAIGAFADFSSWFGTSDASIMEQLDQVFPASVTAGTNNSNRTVMVGAFALAGADDAVSVGYHAETRPNAHRSITIGANARTTHSDAITIGPNAVSHAVNTAVIGNETTAAWHPGADGVTSLGDATYRFSNVNAQSYNVIADAGAPAEINLQADEGAADDDHWRIQAADGGNLTIESLAGGSYVAKLTIENTGNVTIPGEISVNSDIRLKRDIRAIDDALDLIHKIDGSTYLWNEQVGRDSRRHYGLIAQQVESVIPELVNESDNGIKSVNYQAMVPVLVEAIKELSRANAALTARLDQLEPTALKDNE